MLFSFETDKKIVQANGLDLVYLTAKVVDKNGLVVPTGVHNIRFKIAGNGTIAGVGNGDITSDELFQADNRTVYQGECQLIVRSTTSAGVIKVEASAAKLKPAVVEIKAE